MGAAMRVAASRFVAIALLLGASTLLAAPEQKGAEANDDTPRVEAPKAQAPAAAAEEPAPEAQAPAAAAEESTPEAQAPAAAVEEPAPEAQAPAAAAEEPAPEAQAPAAAAEEPAPEAQAPAAAAEKSAPRAQAGLWYSVKRWLSRGETSAGADFGVDWANGQLGRELGAGFLVRGFVGRQAFVPYLRGEIGVGFARNGRSVKAQAASLMRTPLSLSLVASAPLQQWLGESAASWPVPYLRAGVGLASAIVGRGGRTSWAESTFDALLQWGVGVRYPLRFSPLPRGLLARLEFARSLQTESYDGTFMGVILGVEMELPFDADGDGLHDADDRCPEAAEDADGFQDGDGCPDVDNDRDGVLDDDDACPDRAEDKDGFADDDGCPDYDNDGDGIADTVDKCPLEAEDKDDFSDDDGCPDFDNDGDGVLDRRDQCPLEPEDVDGYVDYDGCPDPDNDGDGILDADDKCPMQAEDKNDFQDDDGCPDAKDDQDGDGLVDKVDKCPAEAEDIDGFEDDDGCPDTDNDSDGVPDAADQCPAVAEDQDGFEDGDGCPDYDNDGDGIADAHDKCPNEAEVVNGVDDADGCPDKGAQLVRLTADKIEISDKIFFKTGSDEIEARSFGILVQVATVMKNHREVHKLRVEGHTDDTGSLAFNQTLSQRRAEAVRRFLIDQGVEAERLVAQGFGPTRPIASNKSRAGREMNRRVEFIVVEEPQADVLPAGGNKLGADPGLGAPPPPPPPAAVPAASSEKAQEHTDADSEPSKAVAP